GTLIDTAPDLMGAIDHLLVRKGLPTVAESETRPLISYGSQAMLKRALHVLNHHIDDATFSAWWHEYLDIYSATIADKSRPFPGLLNVLDRLEAEGHTFAVCTNKTEELSKKLLAALKLDHRFRAIVGRDTLPHSKPHPEHLLGTLRRAGGDPRTAVMVGDSDVDILTAQAANIPVIAVTFGYCHAPVASFNPTAVIDHYDAFEHAFATVRSPRT
ncbi:MAG: HAD-IA family hydrolase, partial [Hyphomicrobiaceae bacterium]|nr:HAD-IA family hydrolase [Hyphomicrobiaceae bacterium]